MTPTPALCAAREKTPAGLEALVSKCLEKEPVDRFPTIAAFAQAAAPFGSGAATLSADRIVRMFANSQPNLPAAPSSGTLVAAADESDPIPAHIESTLPGPRTTSDGEHALAKPKRRWALAGGAVALAATAFAVFAVLHSSSAASVKSDTPLSHGLVVDSPKIDSAKIDPPPAPTVAPEKLTAKSAEKTPEKPSGRPAATASSPPRASASAAPRTPTPPKPEPAPSGSSVTATPDRHG